MRLALGLSSVALLSACGGGSISLDGDQRTCPAARVDTESIDFSQVRFADESSATVELRNGCTQKNGDLVLTLSSDVVGFSVSDDTLTLAPGESATVDVTYVPADYAEVSGTLIIGTNDPDVPELRIDLSASTNPDQDGDGFTATEAGGDDCDDLDATINPGAAEVWYDGVDQDCDGRSDFDQDGDGFDNTPEGGDCDDLSEGVYPGAREQDNVIDDDCDGWVDEDFVRPNDVVVSEVMADPVAVFDTAGEWFEIQNISERTLNLVNWRVTDYDGDSFAVAGDLLIAPGARRVFGTEDNPGRNGGVEVDYLYARDAFDLGNATDAVGFELAGNTVTLLEYDVKWGVEPGASLSLDPLFVAKDGATVGYNWCAATSVMSGGDLGTPGALNDQCTSVDHDGDGVSIDDGDCDDTLGTVYPGAPERWNGSDDDCDGIADNATVASVRSGYLDGYTRDSLSYWSSLSTGDVDGDGDLELLVGTINAGGARSGAVYTLDAADAQTWGGGIGGYAEATIEGIGTYNGQGVMSPFQSDVTGDGIVDLVIGGTSRLTTGGKAVAIYSDGSALTGSLDTADADAAWDGGLGFDNMRMINHMDMDGDGVNEIAYGDPGATVGSFYAAGIVYLIDADGASGDYTLADDHVSTWSGGANTEYIGSTLDGADLDGDGYDELVICGQYADFVSVNGGGCAIVMGSKDRPDGGTIDDEATTLIGGKSFSARLGETATLGIGDFDGDNELDLVLPTATGSEVYVYFSVGDLSGEYDTGDADVAIRATGPSNLGVSVGVGDLDGDGTDDLAVGAPDSAYVLGYAADEVGRIWVWSGDTLASKSSVTGSDAFGYVDGETVGGSFGWAMLVADLDGDGVDDLVAGEPNHSSGAGRVSILLLE